MACRCMGGCTVGIQMYRGNTDVCQRVEMSRAQTLGMYWWHTYVWGITWGVLMYGGFTDVRESVQMYRAYKHIGQLLVAYSCMGMYSGVQMYGGVYRCIEQTDIWGEVVGNAEVWGHRIYGGCMGYTNIQGVYRCMGAYRGMGCRCIGCRDDRGHTDILGDVWVYVQKVWGCTYDGVIQTGPKHPDIPLTCPTTTPEYYISYKI